MEKKISVLMVDDEEQFRETTAKILGRKGFEVTMAATGEEAIDLLKKMARDVVVLDMKMPGMDGKEALAAIKKIQRLSRSSCSRDTERWNPQRLHWNWARTIS